MRCAVMDIGSNSVRLVIFEVAGEAAGSGEAAKTGESREIVPIWNKKSVIGLASYIEGGKLSQAGVDRAVETINRLLAAAMPLRPDTTSAFATAVLRNISNSREACEAISGATGLAIDLLSGQDEARLGHLGCSESLGSGKGIVVDMGGGSTEITVQDAGRATSVSFPFGSLSLYLEFVSDVLPTKGERYAISSFVRERVGGEELLEAAPYKRAVCLGGTARSALKLAKGITRIGELDAATSPAELEKLLLASDSDYKGSLHAILRTCPERVHTVLAGTTALVEILRIAGVDEIVVSKKGIREGYLLDRVLR